MDKRQLTRAAFIDLKKAFDLVDHHCLIHKLQHYGVRGHSLTWFKNYLTTRSQRVQYGKELSSSLPIDFGIPQGSLLGPLQFVIYINDLPKCLMQSKISMYADDTVICYSGSHVNAIRENLQEDLKRVEQWLTSNRLIHDVSKVIVSVEREKVVGSLCSEDIDGHCILHISYLSCLRHFSFLFPIVKVNSSQL